METFGIKIGDIVHLKERHFEGAFRYPGTMKGDLLVSEFINTGKRIRVEVLCPDNRYRIVEHIGELLSDLEVVG